MPHSSFKKRGRSEGGVKRERSGPSKFTDDGNWFWGEEEPSAKRVKRDKPERKFKVIGTCSISKFEGVIQGDFVEANLLEFNESQSASLLSRWRQLYAWASNMVEFDEKPKFVVKAVKV